MPIKFLNLEFPRRLKQKGDLEKTRNGLQKSLKKNLIEKLEKKK